MSIAVTPTVWGYHVIIRTADREQFAAALESFKQMIPRNCRLYHPQGAYWYVERRSQRRLTGWLTRMRETGAKIINAE